MNGMHGIIFSYEKKTGLRELIEQRIHGSIPFGGNYRVVDFMLSNMVNAGVRDVGVIMHGKCRACWTTWAPAKAGTSAATTAA